jgi:drug/metabolite transporter (DMT)-like permease
MDARVIQEKSALQQSRQAWLYGGLGMTGFSLTLPMTRLAITVIDPLLVGLGRALVAAALAFIALYVTRQKIPSLRYWWRFALVGGGVVIGFPLLSSLAMKHVPAVHGAVITGLVPIATALVATVRGGERPSLGFWCSSIACCVLVLVFAYQAAGARLQFADIAMIGAVLAAGIGYAEGASLARIFGHWQVICWALLLSAPVIAVIIACRCLIFTQPVSTPVFSAATLAGWGAFIYVSVISMFAAFMLWYRGLAIGGTAAVGQLQFLQPFLTILAATLIFGEALQSSVVVFALGIALLLFLGRYSPTWMDK